MGNSTYLKLRQLPVGAVYVMLMTQQTRKIFAIIILVLLIGVPFWDWKLGAVLWMCAWLVFIFQNIYPGHRWKFGEDEEDHEDE